jgi:hypothetical protein
MPNFSFLAWFRGSTAGLAKFHNNNAFFIKNAQSDGSFGTNFFNAITNNKWKSASTIDLAQARLDIKAKALSDPGGTFSTLRQELDQSGGSLSSFQTQFEQPGTVYRSDVDGNYGTGHAGVQGTSFIRQNQFDGKPMDLWPRVLRCFPGGSGIGDIGGNLVPNTTLKLGNNTIRNLLHVAQQDPDGTITAAMINETVNTIGSESTGHVFLGSYVAMLRLASDLRTTTYFGSHLGETPVPMGLLAEFPFLAQFNHLLNMKDGGPVWVTAIVTEDDVQGRSASMKASGDLTDDQMASGFADPDVYAAWMTNGPNIELVREHQAFSWLDNSAPASAFRRMWSSGTTVKSFSIYLGTELPVAVSGETPLDSLVKSQAPDSQDVQIGAAPADPDETS